MGSLEVVTKASITCPSCGFTREEEMPTNSCQFFYECTQCGTVLRPKEGDCCVFCLYADRQCPPMQISSDS